MLNAHGKNVVDMFVIETVENITSVLSETHQATGPEKFELLADGTLLHVQFFTDCIDASLPLLKQKEDFQSGGISEDLKKVCDIDNFLIQRQYKFFHGASPGIDTYQYNHY